jgi:Kef-type K+ transport system membrane component KefB
MAPVGVIALWALFAMTMAGCILLMRRLGSSKRGPAMQFALGLVIGLVTAFVLVALQVDLVPDENEWAGIAGILVISMLGLGFMFARVLKD